MPQLTLKKRTHSLLLAALVGLAQAGCPPEPQKTRPPAPVLVSRGIITASLTRNFEAGSNDPFEQFSLMGIFPRYDREKRSAIVDLFDVGKPELELALDACSPVPLLNEYKGRLTTSDQPAVELLDVGDLSVKFGREKKTIPTRTFPDLLKAIVGVIYTIDEAQGVSFRPGELYSLSATGTNKVSSFDVVLEAPEDFGDIRVNDAVIGEEVPLINRGEEIDLTWEGAAYGDEIVATLSWVSMGASWSRTCRVKDDGRFVVPALFTVNLPDALTSSDQDLTLTRVRRVGFRSTGLTSGYFSFVISTNFPVKF